MRTLAISLFGSFHVTRDGKALTGFASNKVRALLAYLASESELPTRRETLAGLLWAEQSEKSARHSLSQALVNLRTVLGDDERNPLFVITRETIQFQSTVESCDVRAFTQHLAQAEKKARQNNPDAALEHWRAAVALYRAPFLEGFSLSDSAAFEEWLRAQREQFSQRALNALEQLAAAHEQREELERARQYALRQLELDPLHEPAHRQLMWLYAREGRRAAALRQYRELAKRLSQELDAAPSEETTQLFDTLRQRRAHVAPRASETLKPERALPREREPKIFVTRENALEKLDAFLQQARERRGRVVFVTGEVGSGKTALLHEFASRALRRAYATREPLVITLGTGNAQTGVGDPYLPFREMLELLAGNVNAFPSSSALAFEQSAQLEKLVPLTAQALVQDAPDLIDTFVSGNALFEHALHAMHSAAQASAEWLGKLHHLVAQRAPKQERAATEQRRLFSQYAAVLKRLAEKQTLVLLLDDAQWADAGSLDLLFHLGREFTAQPILMVCAYRAEDVLRGRRGERHPLAPVVNEFKRAFGDIQINLDAISEHEARRFIDDLLDSEPNHLEKKFRDALFHQTRGQPLFTIELVRALQATGALVRDDAGYWREGEHLHWETLPARVEGAIAERIGRLDDALREALTIASVQGETFTAEVIAHVQTADPREIVRRLSGELEKQHRLVTAESITHREAQRLSAYRFRHNLFQRYLYQRLDAVERAYLHEEVGAALETLYGDYANEIAVQLARHFHEAGNFVKAVNYLEQAGDRALRLSAYQEAISLFTLALDALKQLSGTPARARQELALQLALGVALSATRGFGAPEVEQAFARARALCQQIGETREIFPSLWGLFYFYLVRGEDRAMRNLADQLLNLAQRVEENDVLAVAHWAHGVTQLYAGQPAQARAHLDQVTALYDAQRERLPIARYSTDPGVASRFWNAWALWLLGFPDQAAQKSAQAIALAQELAHPFSHAFALFTSTALYQFRREPQEVLRLADATMQLSQEQGFTFFVGLTTVFRGWALAELGNLAEGMSLMRQGVADAVKTGARIGMPHMLAMLAEAHGKIGQPQEGLTLIAEALVTANDSGERHFEAELYRLRGELILQNDFAQTEDALFNFEKALAIARAQNAKSLELRALVSWATLMRSRVEIEKVSARIRELYDWFEEGFETPDLLTAHALWAELK